MTGRRAPIDRATAADTTSLATDLATAPMHVGAILLLGAGSTFDVDAAIVDIGERVRSVPRLRQILRSVPFGCGRPVWVDSTRFATADHVDRIRCPDQGSEAGLLRIAADLIGRPMPRDRPLWSATFVTGLADDRTALIVAFHHVLADGIGGLAVLANLVDGPDPHPPEDPPGYPRPAPATTALFADAQRERLAHLTHLASTVRRTRVAVAGLRSGRTRRAPASTLNRPTGSQRRFAVVHAPLEPVHQFARSHDATVNDVVLGAIASSLRSLLQGRGEQVERFVVSVPVTRRPSTGAAALGNQIDIVTIDVPAIGTHEERLAAIHAATRAAKARPANEATDLLGPVFRTLARLHVFHWYIDRQRFVNTFVTNLRGPDAELRLHGAPIGDIVPLTLATGNVTVSFAVLSYAGTLTVTVIADPETCPDLAHLAATLEAELATRSGSVAPAR